MAARGRKPEPKKRPGSMSKLDMMPKDKRADVVKRIVLGRCSMFQMAKELDVTDTTVARWMRQVTEDERLEILAQAAHDAKIADFKTRGELVDEFGEDTDKDLKWVLRELKALLEDAKDDKDRALQLGPLKELRQSLMALADLHGKLNKKMDIHLNLNESPQFIQLRQIILHVLDKHPAAKADFLDEMKVLKVIEARPPA